MLSLFKEKPAVVNKPNVNVELKNLKSQLEAINKTMAVIQFTPDGTIKDANNNFLAATGYSLGEIVGKHHRIFCDNHYASSSEYHAFWQDLGRGTAKSGKFERFDKQGNPLWLEASYAPTLDENGNVTCVIKYCSDITELVTKEQEHAGINTAINRSMAVIEFQPSGQIITANDNFLSATGYALSEIVGQHHRIFCDSELVNSPEYSEMWNKLNNGQFVSGQFKRVDRKGNTLWLEASYNPIYDTNGKLIKVVKFASDITEQINNANETAEIAEIAYSTSLQADKTAQQGTEVVTKTISLMQNLSSDISQASENLDALNKQSDQINSIVDTISAIADQTNLLALNAAIEAARAGEQGRGFAVVADEVRGLAARTSASTNEISSVVKTNLELSQLATTTMQTSIGQVDDGMSLVNNLSTNISEINAGINSIVHAVDSLNKAK